MDAIVKGFTTLIYTLFSRTLKYKTEGGSSQESVRTAVLMVSLEMTAET